MTTTPSKIPQSKKIANYLDANPLIRFDAKEIAVFSCQIIRTKKPVLPGLDCYIIKLV